jgi:CheY-like chemotaxis protein
MLGTRAPDVPAARLVTGPRPRFRPSSPTVLVVTDDAAARRRYVSALRRDGYTVHVADGSQSAMVLLTDLDPSLTLIDLAPLERMRLVDALMQLDPAAPLFVVDDRAPDVRTAVSVLRRHDEELPPAV